MFVENFNSKVCRNYFNTLDSETFEVNGETIKRKFTKKDIIEFIKFAKKEKLSGDKQIIKELEESMDHLIDYKQTTTLNLKKHSHKIKMFSAVKKDNMIIELELEVTNQAKESKKHIELPEKENRIPIRELAEVYKTSNSIILSDDFNNLLEELKVNRDRFTQEQINQIKQAYKPYLTDEQYKKLEDVLIQSNTNVS